MTPAGARLDVSAVPLQGGYIAKQCPVRAQNNVLLPGERLLPSPAAARRMARGNAFEVEIFDSLAAVDGAVVIDRSKSTDDRVRDTLAAMDSGAALVIGGRLPADSTGRRVGEPDVLLRSSSGYVPVDVKHHRTLDAAGEGAAEAICSELSRPHIESSTTDATSTRRLHRGDLLQLAHYHRMLAASGYASGTHAGIIGVERRVVWHDLDEGVLRTRSTSDPKRKTKMRSALDVYDFEFGFRLDIMAVAMRHQDQSDVALLVVPAKSSECDDCDWWSACGPVLERWPGDVTTVPRVGWEHRRQHAAVGVSNRLDLARLDPFTAALIAVGVDVGRLLDAAATSGSDQPVADLMRRAPAQAAKLLDAGICTIADTSRLDPMTARYPAGTASLPEQIDQARAALGPASAYRRRGVEAIAVPRGDVEVDVDMENSDEGVYLWGALVTDNTKAGIVANGYRPFVTWRPWTLEDEKALLADFWAWLTALREAVTAAGASFRAYCYSEAAENSRLRTASSGTSLEAEVERFIASPEWVDLRPIVEKGIVTGARTGLKHVAPLAGFAWAADDAGGEQSMVLHETATGGTDQASAARSWLLQYNEDDCRATLVVREWLDSSASALPSVADIEVDELA